MKKIIPTQLVAVVVMFGAVVSLPMSAAAGSDSVTATCYANSIAGGTQAGFAKNMKKFVVAVPPTVKLGSSNKNCVAFAQQLLVNLDYILKVDGVYGAKTRAQVKLFQQYYGQTIAPYYLSHGKKPPVTKLTADGIVGPKTWQALRYTFNNPIPLNAN